MCLYYYFNFERNYDVLKSKGPCILLNKNINFNENEMESKMENPTHSFRETNLVLSPCKNCKLKVKLWWVGACKRKGIFCTVYFVWRKFFKHLHSVLSTLSEIHICISKNITSNTFLLVFKIVQSLQCILEGNLISLHFLDVSMLKWYFYCFHVFWKYLWKVCGKFEEIV